jgi:hypothetical protein
LQARIFFIIGKQGGMFADGMAALVAGVHF